MTVGSEAIGSFAIASTNRRIVVAIVGAIGVTGIQGSAIVGNILTATVGTVAYTGQVGVPAVGTSPTGVVGPVGVSGASGSAVTGINSTGVVGTIDVTGQSGAAISGAILSAAVGTVTVTGFEGEIVYAVSTSSEQVQIFDLVNVALNDVFGQTVYYVKDGTTYSLTGTFTDESEVIGVDGQIITTAPQVNIRREDMPYENSPKRGEVLSVAGRTWQVWDWRVDDSDMYMIMLKANR